MSQPADEVAVSFPDYSWRSPDLGVERTVEIAHGRVSYFARGQGPVLVFAHGWLANANLWRKVVRSAHHVQAAARQLIERFDRPVLLVWSPEDPVFPFAHAEAYAGELRRARLERITDAFSFTGEDQPDALASAIARFAAA